MARRRRGHHSRGMKLPIISLGILGAQLGLAFVGRPAWPDGANQFQSYYTGIDIIGHTAAPQNLLVGYGPWLVKRFVLPIARPRLGGMKLPVSLS